MYTGIRIVVCEKKGVVEFNWCTMVPSFFGAAKKKLAFRKKEMLL